MGQLLVGGVWEDAIRGEVEKHEQFISSQSYVSPDGDSAVFVVKYEGREPHSKVVQFSSIGTLYHEVRHATQLMIHRQRLKLDRGIRRMLELCATAVKPASSEVIVEPATGDRLVLFQFAEHAPFCVRMEPAAAADLMSKLKVAADKSAH